MDYCRQVATNTKQNIKMKVMTKHSTEAEKPELNKGAVYVTIDWCGNPITTNGDGYILPRRAEMILNKQYYPTGTIGEWPCDPITGEKLPIEPRT